MAKLHPLSEGEYQERYSEFDGTPAKKVYTEKDANVGLAIWFVRKVGNPEMAVALVKIAAEAMEKEALLRSKHDRKQ